MDSQAGDSAMAGHPLKLSKVNILAYRFDFRQICVRIFFVHTKNPLKLTLSELAFLRLTSPTNALGPAHLGKHI